jgi:hypothetical protein
MVGEIPTESESKEEDIWSSNSTFARKVEVLVDLVSIRSELTTAVGQLKFWNQRVNELEGRLDKAANEMKELNGGEFVLPTESEE